MMEPKPLLREGATDFERRLLSAALGERPSPRLQAQMRRGIGLTGPLVWAGNAKAMLGTLLGKSVLGALGLVVAAGLVVAVNPARAPSTHVDPAPDVAVVEPPERVAVPAPATLAPAAGKEPGSAGSSAGDINAGSVVTARGITAQGEAAESEDSASNGQLREEIRLLDQARGALQRGSAKDARSVLDEYRERFPAGILDREAKVLLEQARSRATSHAAVKERETPPRAH